MDKVQAIKDQSGLCWKCLNTHQKTKIHIIKIPEMGYGSAFDEFAREIHLCDDCYNESVKLNPCLWSMEEVPLVGIWGKHCSEYKYELEMVDYIDSLPQQGQDCVFHDCPSCNN